MVGERDDPIVAGEADDGPKSTMETHLNRLNIQIGAVAIVPTHESLAGAVCDFKKLSVGSEVRWNPLPGGFVIRYHWCGDGLWLVAILPLD